MLTGEPLQQVAQTAYIDLAMRLRYALQPRVYHACVASTSGSLNLYEVCQSAAGAP